jgi:hypothetical protein
VVVGRLETGQVRNGMGKIFFNYSP